MSVIDRIPLKTIKKQEIVGREYEIENLTEALVENFVKNLKAMKNKLKQDQKIYFEIQKNKDLKDCHNDTIVQGADCIINFKIGSENKETLFQLAFKYGDILSGGGIVQHIYEERLPEGMNIWDINEQIKGLFEYMYADEKVIMEDNPLSRMNIIVQNIQTKT